MRVRWVVLTVLVLVCVGLLGTAVAGTDGTENERTGNDTVDVEIDDVLEGVEGEQTVLVGFESPSDAELEDLEGDEYTDVLKAHANRTQEPFERFAADEPHVEIEQQFWITNAAVVTVDTDEVDLEELGTVEYVEAIRENTEIDHHDDGVATDGNLSTDGDPSTERDGDGDLEDGDDPDEGGETADDAATDDLEDSDDGDAVPGFGIVATVMGLLATLGVLDRWNDGR